ncbi:MFS transporter [Sulfurisphaera ohwakuensis]|uniref:MFS transporter n=1 Tax=Sulfurisphaera ohwakuensis TaxID=69656 RepID=UPI0036F33692
MEKWVHATIASTFAWAGNIYDLLIITYVYEELYKCFDASTVIGTLLFSLGLIFRVIGGYVFGKFADIYGRKVVLNLGTAGYSLSQVLLALSPNVFILLLARSLQGLFMGAQWTAGTVIAYENAPVSMRGIINGIVQAGYGLGYALTGLVYIFFSTNWRMFLLTGAIPIFLVPYILAKVNDVKTFRKENIKAQANISGYLSVIIRSTIVISGMFFSYYSIFAVYPEFLESIQISKDYVGFLMFLSNVLLAVSFIAFGRASDKFSKRKLIMYGVIGEMIGLPFMLAVIEQPSFITFGLLLYTIATGFWPLAPLLIVESVPIEVRGMLTGLTYNLGSIIGGIGSIIMGALVNSFGIVSAGKWGLIMGYASLTIVFLTLATWKSSNVLSRVQRSNI